MQVIVNVDASTQRSARAGRSLGLLAARAAAGILLAALLALTFASPSRADTSPIPYTPNLPWTDPAHHSSLEVLAGQIASRIASRQVTIRCEGDSDWRTLVLSIGADPNWLLGYVGARWYSSGALYDISSYAEIAPSVCLALQNFAMAANKPTKCSVPTSVQTTVYKPQRYRVQVTVRVKGKLVHKWVWKTRQVPTTVTTQVPGPLRPCYVGGQFLATPTATFWSDYQSYAEAILTLAHESIHLGGMVGGQLSNGLLVGDQQAEAKAECYGMQWMPYVAEQLGDTPDDAEAIAQWMYERYYPGYQTSPYPQYWSADCRPGGAMDIRSAGSTVWP